MSLRSNNIGDRPIQVESHTILWGEQGAYIWPKSSPWPSFKATGTALWFEAGEEHEIELVACAGKRLVYSMNRLVPVELESWVIENPEDIKK